MPATSQQLSKWSKFLPNQDLGNFSISRTEELRISELGLASARAAVVGFTGSFTCYPLCGPVRSVTGATAMGVIKELRICT